MLRALRHLRLVRQSCVADFDVHLLRGGMLTHRHLFVLHIVRNSFFESENRTTTARKKMAVLR